MKKIRVISVWLPLLLILAGPTAAWAKRPPSAVDCDPTSWEIDPNVDYTLCEPGNNPEA